MRTRLVVALADHELCIGDLTIDVAGHTVTRRDELLPLTPLECDLLTALARRPEDVFTRDDLLHQAWGYHEPNLDGRWLTCTSSDFEPRSNTTRNVPAS